MRLTFTSSETQIREEARAFLAQHKRTLEDLPADFDARISYLRNWQRELYEARLVGVPWPVEFGGRGASLMEQIVVDEELALAGAPEVIGVVGVEVVGPSLVEFGTPEQKARFLTPILSAEEIWCQGFSEPDAGSDLVALRTQATLDGNHFVLRGQKTWTSWAQHAKWCAVLARTDPTVAPHKGISYLLVDLHSPGIEVRPMVQVTGDAEFSEVFFDDVHVPRENILGQLGQGWSIAMHTLSHERGPFALRRQILLRTVLDRLIAATTTRTRDDVRLIDDPDIRSRITRAHVDIEVLKHQCYRSVGRLAATGEPGFGSSVDKLFLATAEQRLGWLCLDVLGPDATTHDDDALVAEWQHTYLYSRAASIYGGTAQVQRNIIAERTLGLPRSS